MRVCTSVYAQYVLLVYIWMSPSVRPTNQPGVYGFLSVFHHVSRAWHIVTALLADVKNAAVQLFARCSHQQNGKSLKATRIPDEPNERVWLFDSVIIETSTEARVFQSLRRLNCAAFIVFSCSSLAMVDFQNSVNQFYIKVRVKDGNASPLVPFFFFLCVWFIFTFSLVRL